MSESSRSRILRFACVMMAVLVVLAHPAIVDSVSAAGNGELTIDVEHKNGNQADEVNALIIYQDGSYYDEIKNYPGVDLKHTFSNLPTGHDYKVNAYIQDQFAGSTGSITIPADDGLTWWDESSKSDQITAENPIELSPTIYYSDGSTPIEGASVRVKSHEDDPNGPGKVVWRTATTESDGETDPSPLSLYPTDGDDPGKYTVEVLQDGEKISSGDYDELNTDVDLKVITDASVPEYDLSASADPSYAGDVDGEPFGSVEQGTEIQLTADPDSGHEFDHWSGDYPSGSREDADISVTVTEDKSLTAHFEEIPEYDLSVSSSSGGTVETSNTGSIQEGTDVSLTADATQGYKFSHWSGDYPSGSREDADISVTMYRDRELTANFEKLEGDLTVDVRHQNGDRAEEVNALVVWQDEVGGEPYKKFENDRSVAIKQKINNLPGDHRYKINAYINDQFAGATDWVNIKNSDKSSTIRVDNPVWIKPTVYYTDGSTPLEDATVKIESHEGTQWRSSTTEEDGLTNPGKLWLFPTNKGRYDVQVYSEGSRVASKTLNSLDSNRDLRLVTSVSPPTQIDTSVVGRTVREETEQDGTITIGERTKVGTTVRNDGTKMPLRVVFQFDTDGDSEPEAIDISGDSDPERVDYDEDGDNEPGTVRGNVEKTTVPEGEAQGFGLEYTPDLAGEWQVRAVIQAKPDTEWVQTDETAWKQYEVAGESEERQLEIQSTYSETQKQVYGGGLDFDVQSLDEFGNYVGNGFGSAVTEFANDAKKIEFDGNYMKSRAQIETSEKESYEIDLASQSGVGFGSAGATGEAGVGTRWTAKQSGEAVIRLQYDEKGKIEQLHTRGGLGPTTQATSTIENQLIVVDTTTNKVVASRTDRSIRIQTPSAKSATQQYFGDLIINSASLLASAGAKEAGGSLIQSKFSSSVTRNLARIGLGKLASKTAGKASSETLDNLITLDTRNLDRTIGTNRVVNIDTLDVKKGHEYVILFRTQARAVTGAAAGPASGSAIDYSVQINSLRMTRTTNDVTPPEITITRRPAEVTNEQNVETRFRISDSSPAEYSYRVQSDDSSTSWSEWNRADETEQIDTQLEKGQNYIQIKARDAAGNIQNDYVSIPVAVDATPPEIAIIQETSGAQNLTFSSLDSIKDYKIQYRRVGKIKWQTLSLDERTTNITFDRDGEYEIRVMGIDNAGNRGEWVTTTVDNTPTPPTEKSPTADAGDDRTVTAGTTVELDASGSTAPDESALTYAFQQVSQSGSSPDVSLQDPETRTPEFTAPDVDSETTLTFELTITQTDSTGTTTDTDTDRVNITITPADDPLPTTSLRFTDQTLPNGSSIVTVDTAQFGTQTVPGEKFVVVVHKTTEERYGDGIGPKVGESDVLSPGTQQSVEVDLSRTLGPSDDIAELTKSQSLVAMLHRADTDDGDNINHGSHITRNGDKVTSRAQVTVSSPPDKPGPGAAWTIPVEYPRLSVVSADIDSDDREELGVGNSDGYGPARYGVIQQGNWIWNTTSSASVNAKTTADTDGDGSPEILFGARASSTWVRSYGSAPASRWSVTHGDWVDGSQRADTDGDGRDEVAVVSGNRGDLTVIDDGRVQWQPQSPANIEGLFGLTEVTGDDTPEILTHSPPNDDKQGLQLITKSDTGGVEIVWRAEPNAPVRATLSELDSDTDASEEVIAAYPGRGFITSLDAETGEMRWREQVEVASADRVRFADVTGDETPEVLLWSDTTLRVFSADSRSLIELSTSAPILRATGSGSGSGDGTLLLLTEDALISRTAEEELTRIQIDGTQVNEMSVGDTDGDNNPEVALGTDGSLRLYDNVEMASSQLEFPSDERPPASVTFTDQTLPNGSSTVTVDTAQFGNESVPGEKFVVVVHKTTESIYDDEIGPKVGESDALSPGTRQSVEVDLSQTLGPSDDIAELTESQSLVAMLHRADTTDGDDVTHGAHITRDGDKVTSRAQLTVSSSSPPALRTHRNLTSTEVTNGSTVTVTVEANFESSIDDAKLEDSVDGPGITRDNITIRDSDGAFLGGEVLSGPTVDATYNDRLNSGLGSDNFTVEYNVTIPEDTPVGTTITFDGTVTNDETSETAGIDGDSSVEVVATTTPDTVTVGNQEVPAEFTSETENGERTVTVDNVFDAVDELRGGDIDVDTIFSLVDAFRSERRR